MSFGTRLQQLRKDIREINYYLPDNKKISVKNSQISSILTYKDFTEFTK